MKYDINKPCPHCGGDPKIANPTGICNHIYFPEGVNKKIKALKGTPAGISRREAQEISYKLATERIKLIVRLFKNRKRPLTAFDVARRIPLHLLAIRPLLSYLSRPSACLAYFGIPAPLKQVGRKQAPCDSHVSVTTYLSRRREK